MPAGEIHIDDIGTAFTTTILDSSGVIVDLSSSTSKQLIFMKPNGSKLTTSASFKTDGTDGKIQYVSVSGDLNVCGRWRLQAFVKIPAGQFRSDIAHFQVHENL